MDRFYLENAALYQKLVDSFDAAAPVPHFSRFKATASSRQEVEVEEQRDPNMIVSARIRPMLDDDLDAGFPCAAFPRSSKLEEPQVVDIHDLYNHPRGRPLLKSFKYQVDRLYGPDNNTQEIYDSHITDLVSIAQDGGVGTLFAYGQTGSGKTFTISELQRLAANSLVDEALESGREVYVTIFDLAGNSASDLLNSRKPISILEDSSGTTHLVGVVEHRVHAGDQLMALIDEAASLRSTASTMKNDASSRSHSICRFRMTTSNSSSGEGFLYLVDLAGSEAARDKAEHGADRMREAKEINLSLSVLKDCIRGKVESEALRTSGRGSKRKKVYVPIRQSTLTKVLKHVFNPDNTSIGKTVVIACVNPSLADVGPSKNTLRYAELLRAASLTDQH